MMVPVVAVRPVHMAMVIVTVVMIVITIGAMHVRLGRRAIGHRVLVQASGYVRVHYTRTMP
jgi:hypothetical protein